MIFTLIFMMIMVCAVSGQEKMSFESPKMTEEEQHSSHLPSHMRCDACTAVAYQMTSALKKQESLSSGRTLKESEYLDVFERVCDGKTWENYGLKSVKGVNRISGKGLEADEVPGMMQGGGKWPGRMSAKCFDFIGDIGEDEIYDTYRETGDLKTFLCFEHTSDCDINKKKNEL